MAITYGFYNSMNGDRKYDAVQLSSIFDGVIRDGVFQSIGGYLATKPGTGMQVIVSPGKAWFDHTWTVNDADLPLDISPSDLTLSRYDAVVLETDATKAVRENSIKVLKGTPASVPQKPTLTNEGDVHQHPLAYILVPGGSTEIQVQNIDIMVGKTECPFVTSILESVSIEALLEKWEGEFRVWFDELQNQMAEDVATNLQNQITRNAPSVGDIVISFDSNRTGPWLKCNGQSYDKERYSELYQKLKKSCSFERPIPIIPGFDSVIFVGDKGFFYKDNTVYVSDTKWSAPVKEHSFMPEEVFSQYGKISSISSAEFFYANGRYFMVVPGTESINSKNEMLYAYSDNGYEWTPKKIHYSDGTIECFPIAIVYHRSMYALIFEDPSSLYIAYLSNLDSESFSERIKIGLTRTGRLGVYVTKNGETIYIMEQGYNNYSKNWKIDQTGAVKNFTIEDTDEYMAWAQVYEVSGKIRRIRSVYYEGNITLYLDEEGTNSYISQVRVSWPEGIRSRGMDIIVEDETPYIFVGKNVFTIEGRIFKLIRDDFPYYVGVSDIEGKYNNKIVRKNLNSHFLIGSIIENRIASSYYKYATTTNFLIADSGVRTNSPEITPYIELDQGIAYIRSEK